MNVARQRNCDNCWFNNDGKCWRYRREFKINYGCQLVKVVNDFDLSGYDTKKLVCKNHKFYYIK